MRAITHAAVSPAGLEFKVGPKGYIHGWIFVGTPVLGQAVHHARLGPGTVTHVTGTHVHVQFSRTGEHRVIPVVHDPQAVRRLEQMPEQDIYQHLMSRGEGHHFDLAVAELDRRDRADKEAKAAALYAEHPQTSEDRDRVYRGLVDAGENPEDAWAHAHSANTGDMRRKAAIAQLREQGYSGGGFDELARKAWKDDVRRRTLHAESVTNGYMTNPQGRAKGINGWDLFTGPETRARKYASPELAEYWDQHGRPTFDDFTSGLLGHDYRKRQTEDFLR